MAGRPNKEGLDYFELDCHMDKKVRLIQAEFGIKGFAIVVMLYQKIYGTHGYYCEWDEESSLLFMSEIGVSSRDDKNLIREIVAACIRRDIFSKEIYDMYGVLTSAGIQQRYLRATSKRSNVKMKKEYLLISEPEISNCVDNCNISDGRNSIDSFKNSQRREEKRREYNNSCALHSNDASETSKEDSVETPDEFFNSIWKLYPRKRGKGAVSKSKRKVLQRIGYENMRKCIDRFVSDMEEQHRDKDHIMYGSTFFNSGYVDYLDENYEGNDKTIQPKLKDVQSTEHEDEKVAEEWWNSL